MARSSKPYRAILIGASTGGVAALRDLLAMLPADFALPLLVVQHRLGDDDELLASLLGQACRLPLREAAGGEAIEDGTVYLAPAGYHLLVEPDATLSLSVDPPVAAARPSIDVLFESAAEVFGPRLMAVILTGMGQDGAAGLRQVHAAGGACLVQDPLQAEAPSIPRHALQAVPAALALPLAAIGQRLIDVARGASRLALAADGRAS